jgi:hypothetical protein
MRCPWIRAFVRHQDLGLFEQSGFVLHKILSDPIFFDVFNDLFQNSLFLNGIDSINLELFKVML